MPYVAFRIYIEIIKIAPQPIDAHYFTARQWKVKEVRSEASDRAIVCAQQLQETEIDANYSDNKNNSNK